MDQIFIAREQQLKQLRERLAQAVMGHGQVCFVSGEAGSGKSTLVNEFIKRAQKQDKNLAAAVGLCDAQSGIGDAYLPFREVMAQLTGDVETKLAQGAITQENAGRLKNMLVLAGQAIVDVGPDLIGVFVPGVGLATKLGTFVAEKVGWLEKLEKLVDKPKEKLGESGIQESHIFEQYANVLCRIAEKNPLLIILDDLHWADAASINLLFHLSRRIGESRIMILGTYRSAEVAIGRGGERHPLEKVLAEFKRYFGEIILDLDKAVEAEGRLFVEGFLDSEPNKLSDHFITNLYRHTNGHPLFTVELLRNMQERGDLVEDQEGMWIESQYLDWDKLPTKVEGVIEERIGRLQAELKEVLTVGSVQGEDFTAEVVARVQQAEAGGLIRKLSGELERQHRLVHGEGIRRLDPGGQRLSLFRFQHNLFRTYLYNELSEAERVYLHEDVGRALEALYAEQADEIAVQLALHFERAGVDDRARHYLQKAGEQAAERYANEEAIEYFTRALALTPKDDVYKHYDLLMQRVEMYSSKGDREAQQKDLDRLSELFLNEEAYQEEKAEILIKKSAYYEQYSMYAEALIELKKAMTIAKQLNITSLVAHVQKAIGYVLWRKGIFKEAKIESEKAHALAQELGLGKIEAQALYDLAVIHWRLGNKDLSKKMAEQVMEKFLKLGNRKGEALAHSVLGNLALSSGHYEQAKDHYQKLLEIDLSIGNVRGQGMAQGNLGIIAEVEGDHSLAVNIFKDVRDVFHRIEDKGSEARAWAHIGLDYALQGAYDQAKENYKKAIEIYREINNRQGLQWVLSMVAWACYDTGLYNEAHLYCLESLDLAQEAGSRSAMDMVNWLIGRVFLAQGDFDQAEDAFYRSASYDDQVANSEEYARMRFASMADLAMARGNQQEAFEIVVEMIKDGFDFPYEVDNKNRVEILLTCYRVFNANQDPRGEEALEKAYQLIIEQAEKISDESMRKSYFENVQANREVLQSYHERV